MTVSGKVWVVMILGHQPADREGSEERVRRDRVERSREREERREEREEREGGPGVRVRERKISKKA